MCVGIVFVIGISVDVPLLSKVLYTIQEPSLGSIVSALSLCHLNYTSKFDLLNIQLIIMCRNAIAFLVQRPN